MKETYKKMTKEELEREYYGRRPTEPYDEDDSPNDWANIVQYAEENLDKAFKAIAELKKENAELKEQVENRNCSNCRRSETVCPNDGSCVHYNKWESYKNPQLTKAKEIIKDYLTITKGSHTTLCGVPEENRTIYVLKLNKEAEQFLKESN